METPINLLKIELESNQKQCEYYKGVDNNLAIQYKKRVVEIKRAIDLLECAVAEPSDESAVLPIHDVSVSFSEGDIVEFTERNGNTKRGYITKREGFSSPEIRCPHPHYEYHPIYKNTILVKKGGWKNER